MPEPILTLIKYVVLALLYLFFLRVLRAVWVELRDPKVVVAPAEPTGATSTYVEDVGPGVGTGPPPAPLGGDLTVPASPAWPTTTVVPAVSALDAPPPATAGRLAVVDPAGRRGQRFPLGDELTVGRAPGCGVALTDDAFVSQLHARIFRLGDECWVEDLGSTNGTFLNETKVTGPVRMGPADRLQVGQTVLEYEP